MAVTATLVYAGHNRLRYLINASGAGSVTITTTGAVSPDLATDTLSGPLKNIVNAFANGYGKLAAGALTQPQARALWLSNDPTGVVAVIGNLLVPTAQCRLTSRDIGGTGAFSVDANVDGGGHPTVIVTAGGADIAYLDIFTPGAI